LLDRVGLKHRLSHRPPMLSVGEPAACGRGAALANRSKFAAGDEPTAMSMRGISSKSSI